MRRVLITGGAGFVGAHLSRELLRAGWDVRVLDNLSPEVHGPARARPAHLEEEVELQVGDLRDAHAVERALSGVDAVCHLAALVGAGPSLHQIADYTAVNALGTAVLLGCLGRRPVERLVVASCLSVYGEGQCRDARERVAQPLERTVEQLQAGRWEPTTFDGEPLTPIPTSEHAPPSLTSIYALSKWNQERMCLLAARAHAIPCVVLRLASVYGPERVATDPYGGAVAAFAARLSAGRAPLLFEDGHQRRDFVSVHDVASAFRLALEDDELDGEVLNIGSGRSTTLYEVARKLAALLAPSAPPAEATFRHRSGDARHVFPDISAARVLLGYRPRVSLDAGLGELAAWLRARDQARPRADQARVSTVRRELQP